MKINVVKIGEYVHDFKAENIFILFGTSATPELVEFSIIIDFEKNQDGQYFREGSKFVINNKEYIVHKVGEIANENFHKLGHVAVYLNSEAELLPGSIMMSPDEYPDFKVGDSFELTY